MSLRSARRALAVGLWGLAILACGSEPAPAGARPDAAPPPDAMPDAAPDVAPDATVDVAAPTDVAAPMDVAAPDAPPPRLVPRIEGDWWNVAGNPDLGDLGDPRQQPVDFGVWRSADGAWHLWSCVRGTHEGREGRLFYRWEGRDLLAPDWTPRGIAMRAETAAGETAGGLQAPFVLREPGGSYRMFYGDWVRICSATSADGREFARRYDASGSTGLFSEGPTSNSRDPMVLRDGDRYIAYYTAYVNGRGSVYARTSRDLVTWGDSRVVSVGGAAGSGPWSSECPFVVHRPEAGMYYLFRTQRYGTDAQTTVYRSPDPLDFGVDDDRHRLLTLPVAAPEIIEHEGRSYIAALRPGLDGIRIARLAWVPEGASR